MPDQLAADLASLRIDRGGGKPRRTWLRVLVVVVVVGAVGWGAVTFGRPYVEARLLNVEVETTEIASVSPAQASVDLSATGYVTPQSTAKIGAKVVGRLQKVNVREGQIVRAGDVLFELDPVDQEAAVSSARARVASANARVATAKAQYTESELNRDREKKLAATGAVPQATVDDLEARLKSLDAQVKAADAEVVAAQAEVQSLTTGLKNLRIIAPMDGTAVTKPAGVGDIVGPTGVPLVELVDMATLLVETDVPEGRLGMVKPAAPCEIALDAMPTSRFRGEVVEIGPRVNRAKATGLVKVRFLDAPPELRPDMSARVSFLQKPLDAAALKEPPKIVVPTSAVADRGGSKVVFVVDNGKVRQVSVKLGQAFGSGFVVESGPPSGTRLVKDPPPTLADGQAIKEKSAT